MQTQAIARAKQLGATITKRDGHGRYMITDTETGHDLGLVQRGRLEGPRGGSVPCWWGYDFSSDLVVDGYEGSMAVAVANVIHAARRRQQELAATQPKRDRERLEMLTWSASTDVDNALALALKLGDREAAGRLRAAAAKLAEALTALGVK